jgi:glycosyltransferase involved in cell wall biosynthesis
MRIAQVAPLFVPVPPRRYGGTERVVSALTEELVRRGHEVTLYAAGSSRTSARLRAAVPVPLWELRPCDPLAYRIVQVEEVIRESADFDIIHSHVDYLPWLAGDRLRAPVVTTVHGRLDVAEARAVLRLFRQQPVVSISTAQRRPLLDLRLNWVGTVHHGFNLAEQYRLGDGDGGYLLFLGRISPEKGASAAIRIALKAGVPLKIAARIEPNDANYFEDEVKPLLDHPLVEWLGEQDDRSKNRLLGRATALLSPIEWDEPFGLAIIEALAAGTPVISRPRGSLPELVRHGEHGFLVDSEEEMVEAVHQAGRLDRRVCRAWAVTRFSVDRMTDAYERIYETLSIRHVVPAQRAPVALWAVADDATGDPVSATARRH